VQAFVENYDVYIMLDTNSMPVRLMSDGSDIIDGIPDWVYEEEVLGTNHALWWSHDSLYLCYLSFNESNVKDFRFPHYGLYDNVYTDIYSISYPKVRIFHPVCMYSSLYVLYVSMFVHAFYVSLSVYLFVHLTA
jgi:hypothetical protein